MLMMKCAEYSLFSDRLWYILPFYEITMNYFSSLKVVAYKARSVSDASVVTRLSVEADAPDAA